MTADSKPRGPKSDKLWANAVRLAVLRESDQTDPATKKKLQYINLLADKLVTAASNGDMQAIKEIGDRLDGKPHQAATIGGDAENPVQHVFRTIYESKPE